MKSIKKLLQREITKEGMARLSKKAKKAIRKTIIAEGEFNSRTIDEDTFMQKLYFAWIGFPDTKEKYWIIERWIHLFHSFKTHDCRNFDLQAALFNTNCK